MDACRFHLKQLACSVLMVSCVVVVLAVFAGCGEDPPPVDDYERLRGIFMGHDVDKGVDSLKIEGFDFPRLYDSDTVKAVDGWPYTVSSISDGSGRCLRWYANHSWIFAASEGSANPRDPVERWFFCDTELMSVYIRASLRVERARRLDLRDEPN